MASTAISESGTSRSQDVPWFNHDITAIDPAFRQLLEEYSKIDPDVVKPHILAIREKAWELFPYPCVGRFNFLALSIATHSFYPHILSELANPGSQSTLLDLGCCFGQDIRKLVYDGAPSEKLSACDLQYGFIDLGYALFADRDSLRTHFFAADIFDENGSLGDKSGSFDFIYAGSFLHLFSQTDQIEACKRIVKLLKPHAGSTVFGRQMGNIKAMAVPNMLSGQGGTMWQHDPQSFQHMWHLVGEETGTKWQVVAEMDPEEGMNRSHWTSEGCRRLKFEVTML